MNTHTHTHIYMYMYIYIYIYIEREREREGGIGRKSMVKCRLESSRSHQDFRLVAQYTYLSGPHLQKNYDKNLNF